MSIDPTQGERRPTVEPLTWPAQADGVATGSRSNACNFAIGPCACACPQAATAVATPAATTSFVARRARSAPAKVATHRVDDEQHPPHQPGQEDDRDDQQQQVAHATNLSGHRQVLRNGSVRATIEGMRGRRFLVLALLAAVAAGCTSSPGVTVTVARPAHSAAARSNERVAEREARRLVELARLPHGAAGTRDRPASLAVPVIGGPVVDELVTATRYWRVPMPADSAFAWLRSHAPRGLTPESSTPMPLADPVQAAGLNYWAGRTPAYDSAELAVSVTSHGSGSIVRVDGLVVWLDTLPLPDSNTATRVRFTTHDACPRPSTPPRVPGVRNTGDDLHARMLPAQPPSGALVCRYADGRFDPHPFGPSGAVHLDATRARALASVAQSLRLSHSDGPLLGCGGYDPGSALLAFAYPGRDDVDLWLGLGSCGRVGNGFIIAKAGQLAEAVIALKR